MNRIFESSRITKDRIFGGKKTIIIEVNGTEITRKVVSKRERCRGVSSLRLIQQNLAQRLWRKRVRRCCFTEGAYKPGQEEAPVGLFERGISCLKLSQLSQKRGQPLLGREVRQGQSDLTQGTW